MDQYIVKSGKKLRCGYTTGTCAAAAAKAGADMLLGREKLDHVRLVVPKGEALILEVHDVFLMEGTVSCCIIKDAGDDPDVTDGISIYAMVKKIEAGITIRGGMGVGRVTRPGLSCKVGETAINPVPRRMIIQGLNEVSMVYGYQGGFEVEIFVPKGEEVAKKTFNERLGIKGGISILGTTGIVEPMSEAALVETIKLEIDSRRENGYKILLMSPGNYGLDFSRGYFGLDIDKAVKFSNYIGEALDYALYKNFGKILLIGHIGKLVKLAAGVMNTHSKIADCRNEIFAAHSALAGAEKEVAEAVMQSANTDEIYNILVEAGINEEVYHSILKKILFHMNYRLMGKVRAEVIIFSNANGLLMKSGGADELIAEFKGESV